MKVSDIYYATPTMKQASSKLGKQVQKSGVAAAKEPRLNLGVIGLSIGQTQSTGLTSRVNEERLDEAVSGQVAWDMLAELSKHIKIPLTQKLPGEKVAVSNFDKAVVTDQALDIVRMWKSGKTEAANEVVNSLAKIRNRLPGIVDLAVPVSEAGKVLEKHGFAVFPEAKRALGGIDGKIQNIEKIVHTCHAIENIVDFVDSAWEIAYSGNKNEKRDHVAFCTAVLKKLGVAE
jgi:hypothetical protein